MKRNRLERLECGDGHLCGIFGFDDLAWSQVIPPLIGAVGGYFGAKEEANAIEAANAASGPRPWPGAEPYLNQYLSSAQDIYNRGGFAPGPTPLELLGREGMLKYGEQTLPGLIAPLQQSWLNALNPQINPYTTSMIQAAQNDLMQDFSRNTLPSLATTAQRAGGYGGGRHGVAEGIAAEGLTEAMGNVSAQMLNQAYQDALMQQQAAWQQAGPMLSYGFMPSGAQLDVGGMQRSDLALPGKNLVMYGEAIKPLMGMSGVQAQPVPSPMWGAIAGASTGYGLYDAYQRSKAPPQAPAPTPSTFAVAGDAYQPAMQYYGYGYPPQR